MFRVLCDLTGSSKNIAFVWSPTYTNWNVTQIKATWALICELSHIVINIKSTPHPKFWVWELSAAFLILLLLKKEYFTNWGFQVQHRQGDPGGNWSCRLLGLRPLHRCQVTAFFTPNSWSKKFCPLTHWLALLINPQPLWKRDGCVGPPGEVELQGSEPWQPDGLLDSPERPQPAHCWPVHLHLRSQVWPVFPFPPFLCLLRTQVWGDPCQAQPRLAAGPEEHSADWLRCSWCKQAFSVQCQRRTLRVPGLNEPPHGPRGPPQGQRWLPENIRGDPSSDPVTRLVGGPEMFVESSSMINLTCLVAWTAKPPDKVSAPGSNSRWKTFSGCLAPQWLGGHLQRTQDRGLPHHWQVRGRKGLMTILEKKLCNFQVTTVSLLLQRATLQDSGNYTCRC